MCKECLTWCGTGSCRSSGRMDIGRQSDSCLAVCPGTKNYGPWPEPRVGWKQREIWTWTWFGQLESQLRSAIQDKIPSRTGTLSTSFENVIFLSPECSTYQGLKPKQCTYVQKRSLNVPIYSSGWKFARESLWRSSFNNMVIGSWITIELIVTKAALTSVQIINRLIPWSWDIFHCYTYSNTAIAPNTRNQSGLWNAWEKNYNWHPFPLLTN